MEISLIVHIFPRPHYATRKVSVQIICKTIE